MRRMILPSLAILTATIGVAIASEVKSGLEVGEKAGAFNVRDCTGPNKGKSLCYR